MAKNISKSVIEDIAYEIKRVGLITQAYELEIPTSAMIENFGSVQDFDVSATDTIEWLMQSLADVLGNHDPTFDEQRFIKQASFTIEI